MQNLENQNQTGKNQESFAFNSPVKVLTASSVIGDSVENRHQEKLGTIKDIMLNIQNGRIEYLILQTGGFLGIGEKLFALPFDSVEINEERQTLVFNADKDFFKKAPGFDQGHWPETNSRHWEDVDKYWRDMGPIYPKGNIII